MPSLSDRLQTLGVKVGTSDLPDPTPGPYPEHPIENVLPGGWWETPGGEIFCLDTRYDAKFQIGEVSLKGRSSLEIISEWAKLPDLTDLSQEKFAFIDTETTGLYGGSGVYPFLIGVARFDGDQFHLAQFFLHEPAQEKAQLLALESFLEPCEALVSFNGKTFDIPILNARFTINSLPSPLDGMHHLDLLHLARRIWKLRLPSRTLGDLEVQILGTKRSETDVPGWMISDLYFDYLHTGDSRPLRGVFYHNEIDVVSMAALLNHLSNLISNPLSQTNPDSRDILSVGKLYAHLGRLNSAAPIFQQVIERKDLPKEFHWDAIKQLSFIYKKLNDWTSACQLWKQAACEGHIYAHEELAKFYEHREKSFKIALNWTHDALEILSNVPGSANLIIAQMDYQQSLEHRAKRLERRIEQARA